MKKHTNVELLQWALGRLPLLVKSQFPEELKNALLGIAIESDRLRVDVDEMRLRIIELENGDKNV
jgi:hypothetical protein